MVTSVVVHGISFAHRRTVLRLNDGRTFPGRLPVDSAVTCGEHVFRNSLAERVHGLVEVSLPFGRADVMTTTDVFEVEAHRSWRTGMRQVLAYGAMVGLRPQLALFGVPTTPEGRLALYLKVRDSGAGVGLWFHGERHGWRLIGSRPSALLIP
jgi:hypothetical protein